MALFHVTDENGKKLTDEGVIGYIEKVCINLFQTRVSNKKVFLMFPESSMRCIVEVGNKPLHSAFVWKTSRSRCNS